ncbi:hypothetical protein QBC32DRAFT_218943 [Pseudoneurospora amorphoporcata]|uniref:Uncharacterized protein n=1 Tax=Pseudoneurospora amorphoporcata TaxID=241081 RepID=A0AAN6NQ72_9PEZI|nr:hypothetical protein QBC32DRAFT_218943 [Pseudoneurospora amorphoporcata]
MATFKNLDELRSKMDPYAHIERWAETLEKKTAQPKPANRAAADQNELIDVVKDVKVTSCMFKDKKYTFTEADGVIQETAVRDRHGRITRTKHEHGKTYVEKPSNTTTTTTNNNNDDYDANGKFIPPTPVYLSLEPVYYPCVPFKPARKACSDQRQCLDPEYWDMVGTQCDEGRRG